jgi:hypothetical protein
MSWRWETSCSTLGLSGPASTPGLRTLAPDLPLPAWRTGLRLRFLGLRLRLTRALRRRGGVGLRLRPSPLGLSELISRAVLWGGLLLRAGLRLRAPVIALRRLFLAGLRLPLFGDGLQFTAHSHPKLLVIIFDHRFYKNKNPPDSPSKNLDPWFSKNTGSPSVLVHKYDAIQ